MKTRDLSGNYFRAHHIRSIKTISTLNKYYPQLDGIRALAALAVMASHFDQYWGRFRNLHVTKILFVLGESGVAVFFVLSGFLITRILINSRSKPNYFSGFYIRRTLRIFPLYYLFLAIFYFLLPLILNIPFYTDQWAYWIYLADFSQTFRWKSNGPLHYWTLSIEEHFYLFWPCVVYYLSNSNILKVGVGLIATSFLVRWWLVANDYQMYEFTFARMDELVMGSALAILGFGDADKKKVKEIAIPLFCVTIPAALLYMKFGGKFLLWMESLRYTVLSFYFACFIGLILSVRTTNLFYRLFKSPPLRFAGRISYGLYIYHRAVYTVFHKYFATGNQLVNLVLCWITVFAIATLSYYTFESFFLRQKDRAMNILR